MIYPTLHIAQDQSLTVNLLDTDYSSDDNPILSFTDTGEGTEEAFMILLQAFLNQYNIGYEDGCGTGYYDSILDEDDGDIEDGEYNE